MVTPSALPMVDPFGRRIRYLRISVTDRCNFRCRYCMPNGLEEKYERQEVLTLEEIARLVRIFSRVGVEKIRLTGGEPLYRKGIVDLVGEIKRVPGIREVCMTTNGYGMAALAPRLKANGLDRVNISIDSLDRERFQWVTQVDGLDKVLEAIAAALEAGLHPVKLNVVVMRDVNLDEVEAFAEWAKREPVTVRFIEYMPFDQGISGQADSYVPSSEVIGKLLRRFELEPDQGNVAGGPAAYYRIAGGKGKLGFISPIDTGFCGDCNRVRLTAVGRLRLCLFSDEGIDLREPLRSGESDDGIERRIRASMAIKPERHHLQEGIPYQGLAMSQVGG